jgi:hypothetical protein
MMKDEVTRGRYQRIVCLDERKEEEIGEECGDINKNKKEARLGSNEINKHSVFT